MASEVTTGKLRTMLDMKLSLGQVLAGSFTTVVTVASTVIYVQGTFETKLDADKKERNMQERIVKVEDGFASQARLQTEIYGDVKKISGILEAQMAEKMVKRK